MTKPKPRQATDDLPHDDEAWPARATQLAAGVTLSTKDGKVIGNAIIVEEIDPHPMAAGYLAATQQRNWLVETDFGNRMTLCSNEIFEMFELGFQQDYERWWNNRIDRISKTI